MPKLKRKESSIQKSVVTWARGHGAVAIKLSASIGMTVGWPDYQFLYDCEIVFMEFKAKGGKLTELQQNRHDQLEQQGFKPHVIDTVEEGKRVLAEAFDWAVEGRV